MSRPASGKGGRGRSSGRGGTPPRGKGKGRARSAGASRSSAGRGGSRDGGARGASTAPGEGAATGWSSNKHRGLGGEQVEGRQAVRELLLAGTRRVREVVVAEDQHERDTLADIVDLAQDVRVPVRTVSRSALAGMARTESPQGVLARAAALPEAELEDLAEPVPGQPAPFLLAVDGVTDPGNLGALLRSAECAGVTGVVLPRHRAVHVTPAVTKAAAGAVEHLPMAVVGGLPTALATLKDRGVWVVGLDAGGEVGLFDLPVADEPVCLVLGAEGAGLGRLVRQRCDVVAAIPLLGTLSSLNVSVAGALACFEVVRRRQVAGRPAGGDAPTV